MTLPLTKKAGLLATLGLTAAFGLYTAAGVYEVPEGVAAVETTGGKITQVNNAGWAHVWPGVQSKTFYNTSKVFEVPLKDITIYYSPDDAQASAADAKSASVRETDKIANDNAQQYTTHNAVVRVSINPDDVAFMHRKYQSMDAIQRLVNDRAIEEYKAVVRKIDPLKINTQRETIGPQTMALLQARLNDELGVTGDRAKNPPIRVESVVFIESRFEKGVENAFETANAQRANIQAEQFKLEQARIKVQNAQQEGMADAERAKAAAEGQASSIEREGAALRANPLVLQLRLIEAWEKGGSKVPETVVSTTPGASLDKFAPVQIAPLQVNPIPVGKPAAAPR